MPIFKLDAGTADGLQAINRPRSTDLEAILSGLGAIPHFFLQSMFVMGARFDSTIPEVLDPWLALVVRLGPDEVQVTTVDRGTQVPGILPVPAARLEAIAGMARGMGVPATAYPCRDEASFS